MSIGASEVKQICIVVNDIEAAKEKWTRILGTEPVTDVSLPPFDQVPTFTDGQPDAFESVRMAVYELEKGPVIELMQPDKGDSPWRRYLDKYGESVMNIAFYVPDRDAAYAAIGEVCAAKGPYHEGFYPDTTYTFVDTRQELGLELNIKASENNNEDIISARSKKE